MINLEKVNSFAKFYETGKTPASVSSHNQSLKTSGLDEAEKTMINKAFPESGNRSLNLYFSNGETRTEQPDARGNHIDFRI